MSVKSDKDKQKVTQEKYQAILSELLKLEENKYCVDCDAKGPRWASWNLGVFLCIRCAGIHRNLGVHLSRVKSVNLDSWTAEQIAMVQEVGNGKGRAIYEANLPDNFRRPQTDSALEALIRAKYEHKKYLARDWNVSQAKIATVSSAQELSKKEKKRSKDQLPAQEGLRGLTYVKNASDSNLASSKTTDRSDNQLAAKSASVQLQKTRKPDQQAADSLPNIELITLASPDTYPKPDATEFGSFLSASVPPITDSTTSSSNAAAGASSDLADLEFFNGIAQQTVSGSSSSASGTCGLATKDDIMALFGPPTSANVFGVPGGMYMPRQQIMCQPGMMQATTGIGYPVMANGMPMMQPIAMTPVSQVVNGSLGHVPVTAPPPYGLYQGYASTQMQPSVSSLASNNGVVWCPQAIPSQQAQQTVAGHTLSNVLWQ